ncbi:MAG: Rpn family recombination-promoting nuclease/putative transposase [Gracilibacteraceae bacterium]|nr:Rpn family recombination-promoting nuclease/putative transposase [Gracilibacteraceae bacterium]
MYDPQTKSQFTDLLEVNILELPKLPPDDGTELWNWMKFLSASQKEELDMVAQKSPQVQKAVARLMELSNDEKTRMLYESRQMMEWDNQVREQEVSNDRAIVIAKNLLEMDLPIEKIVLATGLTREQVEALA